MNCVVFEVYCLGMEACRSHRLADWGGLFVRAVIMVHELSTYLISRSTKRRTGQTEDVLAHSWAFRAVEVLTSLWHFWLPVLDDATDLWLLLKTFGVVYPPLWWACLCVFVIADIERVYTAFFFVALALRVALYSVTPAFPCVDGGNAADMSVLAGQRVDISKPGWLLLDSLLWTLFGSRARSSPLMRTFGLAGEAPGQALRETGLGFHAIDVMVYLHPFRFLGEFFMSFPRGHRHEEVALRNVAYRRKISMVRAVGETLCVDPLFLLLSVVTERWDDHMMGFAVLSALFSALELVTELQYYVTEAEAAKPRSSAAVCDSFGLGISVSGVRAPRRIDSSAREQ